MTTQEAEVKREEATGKLMQSAAIVAPGNIQLKEAAIPEPKAGEVRIRIEGCGLCASNLPLWEGRKWFSYPVEPGSPGHEGWGTIDATGADVKNLEPGDKVAALSYHAFAEYDITKKDHVVKLPESLAGRPFPGEPLGCAVNIFQRSGIKPGMTVAIVGTGFLGSLLVQLSKNAGAKVIALSRRESSLKMAERFGADKIFKLHGKEDTVEQIEACTNDELCDCVIESTGKQNPLDLAARLTGVRGRLVIAGYHQGAKREVDMQLWNWRGIDVINAHERDPLKYIQGMEQAVKEVENGTLNPFPLFTHTYRKEEIQQAFKTHQQKPEGFTKALITFN